VKTETKILGIGMTQANAPKVMSGEKTQTRRIIKNQPPEGASIVGPELYAPTKIDKDGEEYPGAEILGFYDLGGEWGVKVDYRPGDILYVKEALQRHNNCAVYKSEYPKEIVPVDCFADPEVYRKWVSDDGKTWKNKVIPARYMPRSAARTFIEITDVRCERIQDISEADAHAEGIETRENISPDPNSPGSYVLPFIDLWNDTNSKDAWERNDWVFAYTFKLTDASCDERTGQPSAI